MAVFLNIAAVGLGVLAFRFGPEQYRLMMLSGIAAAVLFVSASMLYGPSEDFGVECNRFSKFAEDC